MKLFYISLISLLLSGCSIVPKLPNFGLDKPKVQDKTVETIVSNTSTKDALAKIEAAEAKAQADMKKMQDEYAKTKAEMQKAYDDLRNKDLENFVKIGELNYGIYHVTQEKKKLDINTTIAHLRSKEVMMRTDKLTDADKLEIQKEIADEKSKTIDQLYIKYKQTIELAVNQKTALDDAETLIATKEKEKAALKESNRLALEKLQSEKHNEIEALKAEALDQVRLAKEAQKAEMVGYIVKSLVGLGLLFIILGVIIKNLTFLISGVTFLGLAYAALSVPMWIIGVVAGLCILCSTVLPHFLKKKPDAISTKDKQDTPPTSS